MLVDFILFLKSDGQVNTVSKYDDGGEYEGSNDGAMFCSIFDWQKLNKVLTKQCAWFTNWS